MLWNIPEELINSSNEDFITYPDQSVNATYLRIIRGIETTVTLVRVPRPEELENVDYPTRNDKQNDQ